MNNSIGAYAQGGSNDIGAYEKAAAIAAGNPWYYYANAASLFLLVGSDMNILDAIEFSLGISYV